jgi:predicted CopG family antitoxin
MLVTKGVKVHDDTHRVLKAIKEKNRSKSMDEVIRSLIKGATGKSVEAYSSQKDNTRLSSFAE